MAHGGPPAHAAIRWGIATEPSALAFTARRRVSDAGFVKASRVEPWIGRGRAGPPR